MIDEALEFRLSQYADGSLPATESAAVEAELAADAGLRGIVAEYKKLNRHLAHLTRLPDVNWDGLTSHISQAIDADQPVVAGRIGPARSRWWVRSAVAAVVVGAVTAGMWLHQSAVKPTIAPPAVAKIDPVRKPDDIAGSPIVVVGPAAEVAAGPGVMDVTVGPSPAVAANRWRRFEGLVVEPTTVMIVDRVRPRGH